MNGKINVIIGGIRMGVAWKNSRQQDLVQPNLVSLSATVGAVTWPGALYLLKGCQDWDPKTAACENHRPVNEPWMPPASDNPQCGQFRSLVITGWWFSKISWSDIVSLGNGMMILSRRRADLKPIASSSGHPFPPVPPVFWPRAKWRTFSKW